MEVNPWYQRFIDYMASCGYVEQAEQPRVKGEPRKPRQFRMTVLGERQRTYYVSLKGTVRCSKAGRFLNSYDVTEIFKQYVQLWELTQERDKSCEESTDSIP